MLKPDYSAAQLRALPARNTSFVGIDSDGCVFDTMEIKQKACFHGVIATHWNLTAIEPLVRQTAEFVNLYSRWRGQNRFIALLTTFDLLRERPEVRAAGVTIPHLHDLRRLIATGATLGNADIGREAHRAHSAELASLLDWSHKVNAEIAAKVHRIPPFPWALRSLERLGEHSDVVCISQTPLDALVREWEENGILHHVRFIAAQEIGSKTEHLAMATDGKYPKTRILMIGDALGDLKAAEANGVLFYPIIPSAEDRSWQRFHEEAYARFLSGTYAGDYQNACVRAFLERLPATPPWQTEPAVLSEAPGDSPAGGR